MSFSVLFEAQPLPISLFSLEQAWGVVTRNGLLPELSNSFLFCASQKPDLIQSEFSGVLAAHYGTEKFGELAFEEKQFALSLSGEIETRIFRGPVAEFGNQTFTSRPYRPGSLHLEGLLQLINRPGWTVDEIVAWARPWLKELERHASLGRPREVEGCLFETFLPSNFVDAIPQNLALSPTDGAANFFDLDLHFHTDLPLEFVVFRGLFVVIHRVRSCAKPANGTPTHVGEVVIRCMESLGFAVSQAKLQSFLKLFNSFHNLNAGLPLGLNNPLTREISTRQLPVRPI